MRLTRCGSGAPLAASLWRGRSWSSSAHAVASVNHSIISSFAGYPSAERTMRISSGQVPVRQFQRTLVWYAFRVWLSFAATGFLSLMFLPPRLGLGVTIFVSLVVTGVLMVRAWQNQPACPYCGAEARYSDASRKQWRHRFPFGFAENCHGCGADLTVPFDGTRLAERRPFNSGARPQS